eukprot:23637_1
MVPLWLSIIYYISLNIIIAQHDSTNCEHHMLNISSKCTANDNYYSPTIAIQTLSTYNTKNLHSYSQISLLINANHDVIITPHCVSIDITVNPTIMNYLSHQWLLNKVSWPSDHKQGNIITFSNTQKQSKLITFSEPCIISPNTTNVLILLFNTNFNTYNVEIQNTINCGINSNSITIYDKLYNYNGNSNNNNNNQNNNNNNCFPMQSDARLNLYMPNATNIEERENILSKDNTNNNNAGNSLVIALIIIIVLINIGSCILLWYFNQKQLNKNIKQIARNLTNNSDISSNINIDNIKDNNNNKTKAQLPTPPDSPTDD